MIKLAWFLSKLAGKLDKPGYPKIAKLLDTISGCIFKRYPYIGGRVENGKN